MKTLKEIRTLEEATVQLPTTIVFRRGAIRMLPSGMVAEYHSAEIGKTMIYPNTFSKEIK